MHFDPPLRSRGEAAGGRQGERGRCVFPWQRWHFDFFFKNVECTLCKMVLELAKTVIGSKNAEVPYIDLRVQ